MKIFKIIGFTFLGLILSFILFVFIFSTIKESQADCQYYVIQDSRPNYYIETPNITFEIDGQNITFNSTKSPTTRKIRICKNETYLMGEQ